jgi:hypothetical protein
VRDCRPFTIPQKIKSLRRQAGCIPGVEAVTIIVKTLTKIGFAQRRAGLHAFLRQRAFQKNQMKI